MQKALLTDTRNNYLFEDFLTRNTEKKKVDAINKRDEMIFSLISPDDFILKNEIKNQLIDESKAIPDIKTGVRVTLSFTNKERAAIRMGSEIVIIPSSWPAPQN